MSPRSLAIDSVTSSSIFAEWARSLRRRPSLAPMICFRSLACSENSSKEVATRVSAEMTTRKRITDAVTNRLCLGVADSPLVSGLVQCSGLAGLGAPVGHHGVHLFAGWRLTGEKLVSR